MKMCSSYIILASIAIIIFSLYYKSRGEGFSVPPPTPDPNSSPDSDPKTEGLNSNYRLMLLYVQQNPDKSLGFIKDVQKRFCTDNIDFADLLNNYSPLFK